MTAMISGTVRAMSWPYRRIVIAALAVSLVLNVFFIAGAVWTRLQPPPPARGFEDRYAGMPAQLNLSPEQRAAFDRFLAAMRARNEKMREQIFPLTGAAWNEAAKPQADAAEVLRMFDQAADKRREMQHESVLQTLEFMAALSPEQRIRFVALLRERRGGWRNQAAPAR